MYQPYPTGAQMPTLQRPPVPTAVTNAVKVMYAGAAASILGVAAPVAGTVKIWGAVVWLIALVAVVFLWQRDSTAFFKAVPR
jgi:hypothetical protein